MLRVKMFPNDPSGCGHYRMRWPSEAANDAGLVDSIIIYEEENAEHDFEILRVTKMGSNQRAVAHVSDPECDVVVFQRPMDRDIVEAIPHLKRYGTAVVIELDDLFHHLHPKHPSAHVRRPHLSPEMHVGWLERAMSMADLITVSTPALAKFYGKYGPTRVVRNYINEAVVKRKPPPRSKRVTFGWTGVVSTHCGDLTTIGSALPRVMQDTSSEFFCIGDKQAPGALGLDPEHATVTNWLPIKQYQLAIDAISIGMVPLGLTPFNEAKSYIKGLEFAARGVPFVASPTSEYRYLSGLGAGDLARTPNKWQATLTRLACDPDYRAERAAQALAAAQRLTLEEHVHEWGQAWADARSMRRR